MTRADKLLIGLLIATTIAALVALFTLSSSDQSPRETTLIAIILTIFSMIATWVVSYWHAKQGEDKRITKIKNENNENLRTYALKAAEKLINSSNELNRLSSYLKESLDHPDDDVETSLRISDERVFAAMHLVQTIKSINDTSLSDWEGVIGKELDEKREETKETIDTIQQIFEKIENIEKKSVDSKETRIGEAISNEIYKIRQDLQSAIATVHAYPQLGRTVRKTRVSKECPICGAPILLRVGKAGQVRRKGAECDSCGTKLVASPNSDGEAVLEVRRTIQENVACAACSAPTIILLDNISGISTDHVCTDCGATTRFSRGNRKINSKIVLHNTAAEPDRLVLDPDFLKAVAECLPGQPWPTGVHKDVAAKLGTSNAKVSAAIQELIRQGKVSHQMSGVLYVPIDKSIA